MFKIITFLGIALALVSTTLAQQPPVPVNSTCNTTTVKPTPIVSKYIFKTCIVAEFAVFLNLNQGQYLDLKNGTVDTNASRCENATLQQEPMLVVNFDCGSISLNIGHANDSHTFVKGIVGQYTFNNASVTFANTTETFSTTQSGRYYKCKSEQTVVVKQNPEVSLVFSNVAYEAYRDAQGTDFYKIQEECALDSMPVSDLVRIGVGVCLVALVAIVLIAYFIGRRRWSERSSYESVS